MRGYVMTTGVVFGLITVAHLFGAFSKKARARGPIPGTSSSPLRQQRYVSGPGDCFASRRGLETMRRAYIRSSWLPPALWAATLLYLRPYDGWGAWAAAPLLVPSLVLSLLWGTLGVTLLGQAAVRDRRPDFPVLAATLLSGAAALYYTLRYLLRSSG